jgi:hypothetical protein
VHNLIYLLSPTGCTKKLKKRTQIYVTVKVTKQQLNIIKGVLSMPSLQHDSLNFNNSFSYNFDGGNLSSDSGLLLVRSFIEKMGVKPLLEEACNDSLKRNHSFASIVEQLIYTNVAGYHADDHSDALRHEPIFTRMLGKSALASQPTISRCMNAMNSNNLEALNQLLLTTFIKGNPPHKTHEVILDIDSTLFSTFGKQEDAEFNYHYQSNGFHPLVLFNGTNGDLIKLELRSGKVYTSKNIGEFIEPVLKWFEENYPNTQLILRADSGFGTPELYNLCNTYGTEMLIRQKSYATLRKNAATLMDEFIEKYKDDFSKKHEMYGEFIYQAKSWDFPMRIIMRIERSTEELVPRASFVMTTLKAPPETVIKAYNKRGTMENFIKETKTDFAMDTVSHSNFMANAIKSVIKAIAYNIINIMKRLIFSEKHQKSRLMSIRLLFIKVACKVVMTARKTTFKLCSSYPFKKEFDQAIKRINHLSFV